MRKLLILAALMLAVMAPAVGMAAVPAPPQAPTSGEVAPQTSTLSPEAQERQDRYNAMPYPERMMLALQLCILGMLVVLAVLGALALVIGWLNLRDIRRSLAEPAELPALAATETQNPAAGATPELIAAITAAVAVAVQGRRIAIRGVHVESDPAWGKLGRHQIHSSHSLDRKH